MGVLGELGGGTLDLKSKHGITAEQMNFSLIQYLAIGSA